MDEGVKEEEGSMLIGVETGTVYGVPYNSCASHADVLRNASMSAARSYEEIRAMSGLMSVDRGEEKPSSARVLCSR